MIPTAEAVATAARTLGNRTLDPESLRDLVQGRFVDAMGALAAQMTMEEIHEHRADYIRGVRALVAESLTANGLELETASLTNIDQTDIKLFNPTNAFDAEGMTRLTEEIETRKKKRNDIEQDSIIAIRAKNLEAEQQALAIERESEYRSARAGARDCHAPRTAARRSGGRESWSASARSRRLSSAPRKRSSAPASSMSLRSTPKISHASRRSSGSKSTVGKPSKWTSRIASSPSPSTKRRTAPG